MVMCPALLDTNFFNFGLTGGSINAKGNPKFVVLLMKKLLKRFSTIDISQMEKMELRVYSCYHSKTACGVIIKATNRAAASAYEYNSPGLTESSS